MIDVLLELSYDIVYNSYFFTPDLSCLYRLVVISHSLERNTYKFSAVALHTI